MKNTFLSKLRHHILWLLCSVLLIGCGKTCLTQDELQLVQTAVKSEVIACAFETQVTNVWNKQISEQLETTNGKYAEKLYDIPDDLYDLYASFEELGNMTGSHETLSYKSK